MRPVERSARSGDVWQFGSSNPLVGNLGQWPCPHAAAEKPQELAEGRGFSEKGGGLGFRITG